MGRGPDRKKDTAMIDQFSVLSFAAAPDDVAIYFDMDGVLADFDGGVEAH